MRTFEQRIAEINRRSDEIIKKRKKMRTRLLTASLSLALCVGAWRLASLLVCTTQAPDTAYNEQTMENMSCTSFIEVSAEGDHCLYDEVTVNKILTILNTSGTRPEVASDQDKSAQYAAGQITVGSNESEVREYRITVNSADGTRTVYTLVGSRLTNEETGDVSYILGEDLRELIKLLGLSEEGKD